MNKLIAELQRLYFISGQQWRSQQLLSECQELAFEIEGRLTPAILANSLAGLENVALELVRDDGMARVMVIDFERATDWPTVAELFQSVQTDLDLPAPAISVSGKGFSVWLSLVEPLTVAQLQAFLDALRGRYLADISADRLNLRPSADTSTLDTDNVVSLPPCIHQANGQWAAFIDPAHGANFTDEPWLEMAPPMDKQATRLAAVECIKTADFLRALDLMQQQTLAAQDSTAIALPQLVQPALAVLPKVRAGERMPAMFLTGDEIEFLTGYAQHVDQCRWLEANAWVFALAASGWPVVSRAYAEQKLGFAHAPAKVAPI